MTQFELELGSMDASKRARQAGGGGFSSDVYDPDPQSGQNGCGYDDSTPYPFGGDFESYRRRQTAFAELDSSGEPSLIKLAILFGSVVLFILLVILAALRPWDLPNGDVLE